MTVSMFCFFLLSQLSLNLDKYFWSSFVILETLQESIGIMVRRVTVEPTFEGHPRDEIFSFYFTSECAVAIVSSS